MTDETPSSDPLEAVPDPETVRCMLADSVRRSDLLRRLLRVARVKAAYDQPTRNETAFQGPHPVGREVRRA